MKKEYIVRVTCGNCGYSGVKTKEKEAPRFPGPIICPGCECDTAREIIEPVSNKKIDNSTW